MVLSMVKANDASGNWVEMTKKLDIKYACLMYNVNHRFQQASDTPLNEIRLLGTGPIVEDILNGTYMFHIQGQTHTQLS